MKVQFVPLFLKPLVVVLAHLDNSVASWRCVMWPFVSVAICLVAFCLWPFVPWPFVCTPYLCVCQNQKSGSGELYTSLDHHINGCKSFVLFDRKNLYNADHGPQIAEEPHLLEFVCPGVPSYMMRAVVLKNRSLVPCDPQTKKTLEPPLHVEIVGLKVV